MELNADVDPKQNQHYLSFKLRLNTYSAVFSFIIS